MARKYGEKASKKVERALHELKRGELRSGSGGKVRSRAQAIAIGLSQARERGYKVPPAPRHHASMKTPAQLDAEIAESIARSSKGSLIAVEINPHEFDAKDDLPRGARWRKDLVVLAEKELRHGRSYRRPRDARYDVIEWISYRGEIGRLLEWLERTPGVTRYAEIFV